MTMSTKATLLEQGASGPETAGGGRTELRRELERRGVAAALAERLANDLALLSGSLTPEARQGAVTGMALASAVHQEHVEALRRNEQDLAEIERMMSAFSVELKKVDEAVKILSTFVTRVREQTGPDPDRIVH
jgi:hypothetical protein